jgi:hypothetical protein
VWRGPWPVTGQPWHTRLVQGHRIGAVFGVAQALSIGSRDGGSGAGAVSALGPQGTRSGSPKGPRRTSVLDSPGHGKLLSDTEYGKNLERAKGFEPSTPTLARLCSTPELRPRSGSEARS